MKSGAPRLPVPVYLELGERRVFACAYDWPGWCRAGKDEELALKALAGAAERYAAVAAEADLRLRASAIDGFEVIERIKGSMTTDFGAPGAIAARDRERLGSSEAERIAGLVEAAWRMFDRTVETAPANLRKGPRGGGRDRDEIAAHVRDAESAYASKLGIRRPKTGPGETPPAAALRQAIADAIRTAGPAAATEKGWPPRYAARRIAWHVLDHAWEIEDRTERRPDA